MNSYDCRDYNLFLNCIANPVRGSRALLEILRLSLRSLGGLRLISGGAERPLPTFERDELARFFARPPDDYPDVQP